MRKITHQQPNSIRNLKYVPAQEIIINNLEQLTPGLLFKIMIFIFGINSLHNYENLQLFIPAIIVYFYALYSNKKSCESLIIKRNLKTKSKEGNTEELSYSIKNIGHHHLANIVLFDNLECFKTDQWNIEHQFIITNLRPHSVKTFKCDIEINNGMGNKNIGPLSGILLNPIGISDYNFIFPRNSFMKVYPKVNKTYAPKVLKDERSLNFGLFDSSTKGYSANFYSTKEYQIGDPIKHINWKLSLKTNKTIVNLFENNTNAQLTAVLIDDDRMHFGIGEYSSLEVSKDLILSLFYTQIKSNNEIGFISHQHVRKNKNTLSNLYHLEYLIATLSPKKFPKIFKNRKDRSFPLELKKLEKKINFYTDEKTNLFIFCGLVPGKNFNDYLKLVINLRKKVLRINFVVIYGLTDYFKIADEQEKSILAQVSHETKVYLPYLIRSCRKEGINLSFVELSLNQKYTKMIEKGFISHHE